MSLIERFYPEARFGGYPDIDGTVVFFNRVQALLRPGDTVLDIGCGRGSHANDPVDWRRNTQILRHKVAKVIGLDTDPEAAANPLIDEFVHVQGEPWPLPDASIDLALCDWVIEHLEDPERTFAEASRVLKPGGYFCARTSNRQSYVSLLTRLIPDRFHRQVIARAQPQRRPEDMFRTRFRCNTAGALRRALARHGLEGVVYGYEAEPQYLAFSRFAYRLGVWHQKLAPAMLKPTLFVFCRKTG